MSLWAHMCKIDSVGSIGGTGGTLSVCLRDRPSLLQLSLAEFKPTVNIDPQRLKFYTRKQVREGLSTAQHKPMLGATSAELCSAAPAGCCLAVRLTNNARAGLSIAITYVLACGPAAAS